jgi:hypothetical protein
VEASFLPIAVRAFTKRRRPDVEEDDRLRTSPPPEAMRPTYFVAIDTETTTDASQRLLFGAWRYCRLDWSDDVPSLVTLDEGLFFEDDLPEWDPDGYETLRAYASERWSDADRTDPEAAWQLRFQAQQRFAENVIWRAGYEKKAHLVFFNAGFDISRLAVRAADARASRRSKRADARPPDRRFVGGFSLFVWPPGIWRPWFKIKHLDSKRALKRFGGPKRIDPDNLDDSEEDEPRAFAGHILDCRTLAFALTNEGHSLESACEAFGVPYTKRSVEHGRITPVYIDYCREDVEATATLCRALLQEYALHPIELQPTRAFSPASIAKGYLRAMGITPPSRRLGEVPEGETWDSVTGFAMTAYFGGRTETRVRRVPVPVVVLDFKSEYPTVCRLLGAWPTLTADRVHAVQVDPGQVQSFVDGLKADDLFDRGTWSEFNMICQVEPTGEILPVRARYDEHGQLGIGVNPFYYDAERLGEPWPWYALPDVVTSRVLGGRAPRIRRAIRFEPRGNAPGLSSASLRGTVQVDASRDDFFHAVVEERERRYRDTSQPAAERERLNDFLKVLANSAGYGIYAEMNRAELPKRATESIDVYGLRGFTQKVRAPEQPGEFFFAPLAATVTAAGRLLLAMLESEVTQRGGTYAVCDTDSAFVVATESGGDTGRDGDAIQALSWAEVRDVQERFRRLSPYDETVEVLKAERGSLERELRCFAISAKRYALYRETDEGTAIEAHSDEEAAGVDEGVWDIAKPSQHGLGHLLNPIDPESESRDWIKQAWRWLMALDLGLDAAEPEWLDRPAISQVTISTPGYWHLFDRWNEGRPFAEAVKPFGFMLVAYADPLRTSEEVGRLVRPFERDPRRWLDDEWLDLYDPDTRYKVAVRRSDDASQKGVVYLKTYRDVLYAYLGHPESKSIDASGLACRRTTKGVLYRRPVEAATVTHIGKEANRLEDRLSGLALSEDEYLLKLGDDGSWDRLVLPTLKTFRTKEVVIDTGLAQSTFADIASGRTRPHKRTERVLRHYAYRRAGHWLKDRNIDAPSDSGARQALYLDRRREWLERVHASYSEAVANLKREALTKPGLIGEVSSAAHVSRRRIFSLKDPLLQERVVQASRGHTAEPNQG